MTTCVTGPIFPVPIFIFSSLITGVISAAVPERKTSSADFNSFTEIFFTFVFRFRSLLNFKIDFLVIPSNADELNGGVINVFFLMMNIFSPGASLTFPFLSNATAPTVPIFSSSFIFLTLFRFCSE